MGHEFEDSSVQQKQQEWHKLILKKGCEIVNVNNAVLTDPFVHLVHCISWFHYSVLFQQILKGVSFELHVQEPFFSQLNGICQSVLYLNMVKFNVIRSGNYVLLLNCVAG